MINKRALISQVLTFWIPKTYRSKAQKALGRVLSNARNKYLISRYRSIARKIGNRTQSGQPIRVCFYVLYDSIFQSRPLFEAMLKDEKFAPFILIIPDTYRGDENMFYQMNKAYTALSAKYDNVICSYDDKSEEFIDHIDKIDIICFNNLYDENTHRYYTSYHARAHEKLYFVINYSYMGRTHFEEYVVSKELYKLAWKVYTESPESTKALINMGHHGKNIEIVGYCKTDAIANIKVVPRERKRIIIAPHHSILGEIINISCFLLFADYLLCLPKKYPSIDFIFRPHPLLFYKLKMEHVWGEEKTHRYKEKLCSYPNLIFDTSDSYLDLFVNSDALIHDCGSFLAEYFYTNHPQCYLLRDRVYEEEYISFGRTMLDHTYKAYTEQEITHFIDEVVLKNNDNMKSAREQFAQKHIMYNFPKTTQCILNNIKKEILI